MAINPKKLSTFLQENDEPLDVVLKRMVSALESAQKAQEFLSSDDYSNYSRQHLTHAYQKTIQKQLGTLSHSEHLTPSFESKKIRKP